MRKYVDKAAIFILCMAAYMQCKTGTYIVVPIICALIISTFMSYKSNAAANAALFLVSCIGAAFYSPFLFFLPILSYDVMQTDKKYLAIFGVVPICLAFGTLPAAALIYIVIFSGLSFLLGSRTAALEKTKSEYIILQDTEKEFTIQLEEKNRELMDKQDYEINIATLNERNRIARDIHDSIGHLLSNSILQTGALMTLCRDENMKEMLETLRETLTTGMNSVRDSIHGLYEESVDLYAETKAMTDAFDFCSISLDYDIDGNPERNIKYALIYIIKEALTNIIKHSDASAVTVTLKEHPALYQLIVKDNGTKSGPAGEGIGLKNIEQRVVSLRGITNFGFENGFTVFVSIPKEKTL